MDGRRRRPSNMGQLCRLCLTEDVITLPIFGEEESSQSQIPLSFRIMACVSVEVTQSDEMPTVICEKCLNHINTWHEFKQVCDTSQATLKEWLNSCHETVTIGDKDIYIKQEPLDEEEDEVMEITDKDPELDAEPDVDPDIDPDVDTDVDPYVDPDVDRDVDPDVDPYVDPDVDPDVEEQYMVDYIKQEVDSYDEERQDCESVESVHEDSNDPLCVPEAFCSGPIVTRKFPNDDVEIIPIPQTSDVSHLRITDIKTESDNAETVDEVTVTPAPSEGRLLRSVLQGKTRASMYTRSAADVESLRESPTVKPYHCQTCGKSFAYNYLLKRHAKIHMNDHNICTFCHKGFSSQEALEQHVQLWNENGAVSKPYSCDHCSEQFGCRTQYLMHADGSDGSNCIANHDHIVTEDGSYKCEECSNDFSSVMLLRLHMRKEHLRFSCHRCNKIFSNGVSLSNHLRSHSSNMMRHYCEKCPISFTTPDLLKKHEKTHERETAMTVIPPEVVTNSSEYSVLSDANEQAEEDEIPVYETIKQEPPDSPEILSVTPDPVKIMNSLHPHVCNICNEDFPTLASLRFHLKGVHLHYQCHRCPKVFGSGVALSNHLRSHSSVTPTGKKHKCLVCLKGFGTVDLLMKHKKIHSDIPKESEVKDSLNPVLENELEITPLENNDKDDKDDLALTKRTCSVCNTVLASPSALERHMTTHNKNKLFTCRICNASMTYASSLQKHYRVMHGQVVDLKSIQKNPSQKPSESVKSSNENISTPSETQVTQEEMPQPSESFTRSGRRILSFNRTLQVSPPVQHTRLPTPFECKICHRRFAYRSFLLKHSKVHEKQNPPIDETGAATCQICFKTFADAKTLNNHKGVHTRFKHYGCNTCGKSFNGLNAWRKHERMHQKGFIYSCKLCGKKFLSKAELHSHKKMHIKLKIYTCSVCKNSYHSSSALGKHKRRHNHYSASAEETDVSDVEVLQGAGSAVNEPVVEQKIPKTPTVKASKQNYPKQSYPKQSYPKQSVPKSSIIRNPVSRQIASKSIFFPSGKRRPFCALCNKVFSNVRALRRHKLMHDRIAKPLSVNAAAATPPVPETSENMCLTCNRAFPDHTSLVRHKGWHTRRFNFPVTNSVNSLPPPSLPHVPSVSPEPMPLNPCFVKLEPSPGNVTQCELCYRTFSSQSALENHMRTHSDMGKSYATEKSGKSGIEDKTSVLNSPRRLACKICKKPFESKKALITHIGWHSRGSHSLKPLLSAVRAQAVPSALSVGDKYTCNVCHKFFSSAVMLSKHKKLHTQKLMTSVKVKAAVQSDSGTDPEGDYQCPVCLKVFKFVKYLNLHMRLHTGEKRFKCNLCNQAYHRSGSLWKHKRTHHAFKVFCCHICQKRFGLKNQLTKHMESHGVLSVAPTIIHKTYTVYACSCCDKTFAKLEKLRQHERIHRA